MELPTKGSDSSGTSSMAFTNDGFEDAPLSAIEESASVAKDPSEVQGLPGIQVKMSTPSELPDEVLDTKLWKFDKWNSFNAKWSFWVWKSLFSEHIKLLLRKW